MNYKKSIGLSPLKWLGNKRDLARAIQPLIEREICHNSTVIEPFCGSLGFSLHFGFKHVKANDNNRALINFYKQQVKGHHPSCHWSFSKTQVYYQMREEFRSIMRNGGCDKRLSDLFMYLNTAGFNGLYRENRQGVYNTPSGDATSFPIEKIERCRELARIAKQWQFTSTCYSQVSYADAGLVVVDPPYQNEYVGYLEGGFNLNNQFELAEKMASIDAPIILSNSISHKPLLRTYKACGFKLYAIEVNRSVAANGNSRGRKLELVALKGFGTKKIRSLCPSLVKLKV